ncbi:MAG TPA: HAMP domain-containing sensor histidine kinase, partial [Abditibacteriaceae bacterium]
QGECLDMATRGGERLLGMINELLDISKMEDGSLHLEKKPVDAASLIQRAVSQITYLAEDKNLTLQINIAENLSALSADEDKLVRVLVNLCGNAIKFTPSRGTVTLSARAADSSRPDAADIERTMTTPGVVFTVADTGEGIPADYFHRIFEKFGQVETRQAGRKMSTGLGLAFCKMVVELHGGTIWVQSELGKGSTFSFALFCE